MLEDTDFFERIFFMLDSWKQNELWASLEKFQAQQHSSPLSESVLKVTLWLGQQCIFFYAVKKLWVWKPVSGFYSICLAAGHLSSHLIQELAFSLFQVGSSNALVGTGCMQSQQATKNSCCLDSLPLNSNLKISSIKEPSVCSSHHSDMLLNQQRWWHHLVS